MGRRAEHISEKTIFVGINLFVLLSTSDRNNPFPRNSPTHRRFHPLRAQYVRRDSSIAYNIIGTQGLKLRRLCFWELHLYILGKTVHCNQLDQPTSPASALHTTYHDFSRKKRMKMPGKMMKVVWQIYAASYPEITSFYFLNSKKNIPALLFLVFSEMNRPCQFPFQQNEKPRACPFTVLFLVFSEMNRSFSSIFSKIIRREHARLQYEKDPFARLQHSVQYKILQKESLILATKSQQPLQAGTG